MQFKSDESGEGHFKMILTMAKIKDKNKTDSLNNSILS